MFKDKYDLFQHVKQHLLRQNAQSKNHVHDACRYRDQNGLACAVGCCIPDELYSGRMEGGRISIQFLELFPGLSYLSPYLGLLDDLQRLHDSTPPQYWKQGLLDIEAQLDKY